MGKLIAITGKGGVGKTTISGLIVNSLIYKGCKPVLAIDADPNTCLDAVLGVKVEKSVGTVREEARELAGQGNLKGISKQELLEFKIAESLVEANGFDLIAMGRSEGPGCYCYANNVLKAVINEISINYPYIVLDNEAGLENLSRRIVQNVDVLIVVSDPSNRGLETVKRLYDLSAEMGIKYKKLVLIVNRTRNEEPSDLAKKIKSEIKADYIITVTEDNELTEISEGNQNVSEISARNKTFAKINSLMDEINITEL